MQDKKNKELQEFLSANTLVARLVNSSDLRGLPGNKVDVLMDTSLTFRAYTTVPVLPRPEDTVDGVFYILPDDTLNYVANGQWITLSGLQGADGTTFYPSVSDTGVLSWTNDGGKANPKPVALKGPKGATGPKGKDGSNANAKVLFTTGHLTTALTGTTQIDLSLIPGAKASDISAPETEIYDEYGTLGVVTAFSNNKATVQTVTTTPGERHGVRLGAVDTEADLPSIVTALPANWQTPMTGDFAYVRSDSSHGAKLTEWLVTSINQNTITWAYSHTLNAGDYVVDVNLPDGTLIPKNQDGTVTLPQSTDTTYTFTDEGTGFKVTGSDNSLYTYTGSKNSDGSYFTTTKLSTTIDGTTTVPANTISGLTMNDIVLDETLIYDADGTLGRVSAKGNNDLTVTTMTVSGSGSGSGDTVNVTYNTARQGEELKSSYAVLESDYTSAINDIVPFVQKSGNFNQPVKGEFIVPDGTRIETTLCLSATSAGNVEYSLWNVTDNKAIDGLNTINGDTQGALNHDRTYSAQWTNNTGHSVTIGFKVNEVSAQETLSHSYTNLTIKEIGRIVDPMKYADNSKGFDDVPVGSIIQMYSDIAPAHYLPCDGTEYKIGSYPELEAKFVEQFGRVNPFGGDGVNTYALPNLFKEESVTPKPSSSYSNVYTVSATSFADQQYPDLLFNGELDRSWAPDTTKSASEQYIRVDFKTPTLVTKYTMNTRVYNSNDVLVYPKDFTLEGSNDNGATWTVIDTRTGESGGASKQLHTYKVAKPGIYSSYRIGATSNNGASGSPWFWAVAEIDLLRSAPSSFIKYESTMKAFYGAGNYKVSGTFGLPAAGAWGIAPLTGTTGDTDMIQDGKVVIPQTGWYNLTAQYGIPNINKTACYMTWQKRSDAIGFANRNEKILCVSYVDGTSALTLNGTVYLEKGDIVTLQCYFGITYVNVKPTFTVAFLGSDITINQLNLIGSDEVYSNEEQLVGSWMGKPLYKRTIHKDNLPAARDYVYITLADIAPGVTTEDIKRFWAIVTNENGARIQTSYTDGDYIKSLYVLKDKGIAINSSSEGSPSIDTTVYYTKSTDTENSAPNKNSLLLTRPDLWEAGVEYDFGGGLYGKRIQGTASTNTEFVLFPASVGVERISAWGGTVKNGNGNTWAVPATTYEIWQDTSHNSKQWSLECRNGDGAFTDIDVWVTYTK